MLLKGLLDISLPPRSTLISTQSSNSFLQDPNVIAWIAIGVAILIGVATVVSTIVAAIYAVRKQQNKREVSYEVMSDAPIASIDKVVEDKVEIRFDGHPVKDLRLLVMRIWNSGNTAITSEDYEDSIKFEFEGRKVINGEILDMEPEDLIDAKSIKTFIKKESELIRLSRFLLNPKESISLKVLLAGPKGKIRGRARIRNGKLIEYRPEDQPVSITILPAFTLIMFYILIFLFLAFFVLEPQSTIDFLKLTLQSETNVLRLKFFSTILFFLLYSGFLLLTLYLWIPRLKKIRKNGIRFKWLP